MEDLVSKIEKKCHEKLMNYHDLLNIFRMERKSIISGDVTALWRFSSQKHEKAKVIETIRGEIVELLNKADIQHEIDLKAFQLEKVVNLFSGRGLRTLTEILMTVNRVKKQIQASGQANLLFIQDYLDTINDLVTVVVSSNSKASLYNRKRGISKNRDSETVLIRREV